MVEFVLPRPSQGDRKGRLTLAVALRAVDSRCAKVDSRCAKKLTPAPKIAEQRNSSKIMLY